MTYTPPNKGDTLSAMYDETFFKQHEKYQAVYEHLALMVREFSPKETSSIVDVGCGHCLLLSALGKHFSTTFGIDGSQEGVPNTMRNKVIVADMAKKDWAVVAMPRTDVVVSFETAEHIPESGSDEFVRSLISHNPRMVFFGAATSLQDLNLNPGHLNEQRLHYWVEKFERNGYCLTPGPNLAMRSKMILSQMYNKVSWYIKNLLVFVPGQSEAISFTAEPPINGENHFGRVLYQRDFADFENLMLKRLCTFKNMNNK